MKREPQLPGCGSSILEVSVFRPLSLLVLQRLPDAAQEEGVLLDALPLEVVLELFVIASDKM